MNKLFILAISLNLLSIPSLLAQERHARQKGKVVQAPLVHDPVMAKEGDTYYMFSTGWNISVMSTRDLKNWRFEKEVFNAPPQWAVDRIKGYEGHTWAPDIIYYDGAYHIFYSCSTFGKNTSAIGHAYRRTLDPTDTVPWTDTGLVIDSKEGKNNYNAIDPNIILDKKGNPWMSFGSFWGGIQLVRLTKDMTSTVKPERLYTICDRREAGTNAVEAPFIFKHGKYYYLFVSFDYCCKGLKSNYNVVVGRSRKITGPYLDKDGKDMAHGGGTPVVASNSEFVAIGHSAAYRFGDKDYFMAHGYSRTQDGASKLFLCEMTWDKDGWPVVGFSK